MRETFIIDTNVISHYLAVNQNDPEWQIKQQLADALFDEFAKKKARVMIPTPVLLELLYMNKDGSDRKKLLVMLQQAFQFADFSADAAAIGADLMRGNGTFNKLIQENGQRLRDHLRTDTQIIAIALANHADAIYSEDKHFQALSQGKIPIKGLPSTAQMQLPEQ